MDKFSDFHSTACYRNSVWFWGACWFVVPSAGRNAATRKSVTHLSASLHFHYFVTTASYASHSVSSHHFMHGPNPPLRDQKFSSGTYVISYRANFDVPSIQQTLFKRQLNLHHKTKWGLALQPVPHWLHKLIPCHRVWSLCWGSQISKVRNLTAHLKQTCLQVFTCSLQDMCMDFDNPSTLQENDHFMCKCPCKMIFLGMLCCFALDVLYLTCI